MFKDTNNKKTGSGFLEIVMGCIGLLFIMLFITSRLNIDIPTVLKEFVAGSKEYKKDLSKAEINSLVGLSTSELRQKLGKPNFVRLEENSSVSSRSQNTNKDKPDETWVYFRKVNHEASGTKMSLTCDIREGKCIAAKSY